MEEFAAAAEAAAEAAQLSSLKCNHA